MRLVSSCFAALCALAGSVAFAQLPIDAFVHRPVISGVSVSPDGRHLAGVSPPAADGIPQITVWNADDLSATPLRFDLQGRDGSRWLPQAAFWLNSEKIYTVGAQTFDVQIGARTTKTFRARAFVYDLRQKKLLEPFSAGDSLEDLVTELRVVNRLPLDDNRVLVSSSNLEGAVDFYEMDLTTFRLKRLFRGATGITGIADLKGDVRGRRRFLGAGETARLELEIRKPGSDAWTSVGALYARDRGGMDFSGFAADPNILYMLNAAGGEYQAIHEYDLTTGKLSEPIFAHPKYNATGVILGSTKKKFGQILGFSYDGPFESVYWVDGDRVALEASLKKAFPGQRIEMGSFSDDETRGIVLVHNSNDPGTYYLYDAKRGLISLGRPYPLLDPAALPKTEFVNYTARDGLTIPAFLTLPLRGSKPYPLVVMPHGGPWARDYQNYDQWRSFLADRGYAVLQPQYRGSFGWSKSLWLAGDREWGQKMQDDKDDGARWLVERGIADPNRLAIYGFSYGGYAAMASIVRPSPPWQCAIAGAGLSELRTFDKLTFESRFGREFQNPTISGLHPIDNVDKASIPIMIFHGDRDQIVPIEQSEKYYAALKRAGKNVQYVEIKDYGHGPSLSTSQPAQVLQILETYLAKDCGPGGL